LTELISIGARYGITLRPVTINAAALNTLPLPVILHLRSDHYVVFVERVGGRWLIADPARGGRMLRAAQVQLEATGAALIPAQRLEGDRPGDRHD
jgi:ABC-type bacteriocin/lantibiotic exporter with double-glycine peptidase domain